MEPDGEPFAQNEVDEVRWVPLAEARDDPELRAGRELLARGYASSKIFPSPRSRR